MYSKTYVKRPLKIDKTKILITNGSLIKVESIADEHSAILLTCVKAIVGLENKLLVFFRVAVLQSVYCISRTVGTHPQPILHSTLARFAWYNALK